MTYISGDVAPWDIDPLLINRGLGPVAGNGIASPANPLTAAVGSSGALNSTYYYTYTYRTSAGETAPWPGTFGGVTLASQQANLSNIAAGPTGTISRLVYRTKAGTQDVKDYYFVAEIADNTTTTFVDNVADASLGSPVNWSYQNQGKLTDLSGKATARFAGQSVSLGEQSFNTNVGYASVAIGYRSLASIAGGRRNTSLGAYAGELTTSGYSNAFYGTHAGNGNTTGSQNCYFGQSAGGTTANHGLGNIALGYGAMDNPSASYGNLNVVVGYQAMSAATATIGQVVAVGPSAGKYASQNRELFIDTLGDRGSAANERDNDLIYGRSQSSAGAQDLRLNSPTRIGWGAAVVANLPTASTALKGYRAYVTDASIAYSGAAIGTTVAGGGSNTVPVFCNGTNWVIG